MPARLWPRRLLGQPGSRTLEAAPQETTPCADPPLGRDTPLPKSVWLLIQPMALVDTSASRPEPTKEPTPEKKKNKPMMALCMDLGAAEYANSRPGGVGGGL